MPLGRAPIAESTARNKAANADFERAVSLHQQGQVERAEVLYREILAAQPEHSGALHLLGVVVLQKGDCHHAVALIRESLHTNPNQALAHSNLGNALLESGEPEAALAHYTHALALKPDLADAFYNRGNALRLLHRLEESLAAYESALSIAPRHLPALFNRGNVLSTLGRYAEAVLAFDRLLALKPDHGGGLVNRGVALQSMRRYEEALKSYRGALRNDPTCVQALNNCGTIFLEGSNHEAAADCFSKVVNVAPDYPYACGHLLHSRLHGCNWNQNAELVQKIRDGVRTDARIDTPFPFLAVADSPVEQLQCARTFAIDKFPSAQQPLWKGDRYEHDRIRVAYLSADFHGHATASLISELFELHDRRHFEITAVSYGPAEDDDNRRRLRQACERFVDVGNLSDLEAARFIRSLEIDIAVDLKGFTSGCRPAILAHRPAPIQVNYLGYPGTMGTDYIDYLLADEHVVPHEDQIHYAEKVVYLPNCYQVNDSRRLIAAQTSARAEVGLPAGRFVFCCFNGSYKITPAIFDAWMRLLRAVPGSVLWLLSDTGSVQRNLQQEASVRGIDPGRLIFASRTSAAEHLARHRLADLFLDTVPINAHTTASDALWAGLPVLTCQGRAFAGRVAASLLHAVGLPELVCTSLHEYEQRALLLATTPDLLAGVRATLAERRSTSTLFSADLFRTHLENAYRIMWARQQCGQPPEGFAVTEP